jgi:predicted amidophosphoribosyltransferase
VTVSERVCPSSRCAELNPPDALICGTCGRALVPDAGKPRCQWCGRKISYGAKSCSAHKNLPDPYEVPA